MPRDITLTLSRVLNQLGYRRSSYELPCMQHSIYCCDVTMICLMLKYMVHDDMGVTSLFLATTACDVNIEIFV